MLFLFTSLSKFPSRKGVENKHNYDGFVLINCQILRTNGKENNMLKLWTESSH